MSTPVEERYEPAEQAAAARRIARGRLEHAKRDSTETRNWWTLSAVERQQLVDQARKDLQPRFEVAHKVRACAVASESSLPFFAAA